MLEANILLPGLIALPACLLLIARVVFRHRLPPFDFTRLFPFLPGLFGSQKRTQKKVQLILNALVLEQDYQQAAHLLIAFSKKQPDLWFLARQEIALSLRQVRPDQAFIDAYQEAVQLLKREQLHAEFSASCFLVLLGSAWQVQDISAAPLEAANNWHAAGLAYQRLIEVAGSIAQQYREAAFHCYFHALHSYQALDAIPQQVNVLFQFAFLLRASSTGDEIAREQAILDCYLQVQHLLDQGSTPPFRVLTTLYSGLINTYYELYKQLRHIFYLQQAIQVYNELEKLSCQYPQADQTLLHALQTTHGEISKELLARENAHS